jgi:hypothetical protein
MRRRVYDEVWGGLLLIATDEPDEEDSEEDPDEHPPTQRHQECLRAHIFPSESPRAGALSLPPP